MPALRTRPWDEPTALWPSRGRWRPGVPRRRSSGDRCPRGGADKGTEVGEGLGDVAPGGGAGPRRGVGGAGGRGELPVLSVTTAEDELAAVREYLNASYDALDAVVSRTPRRDRAVVLRALDAVLAARGAVEVLARGC